MLVWLQGNQNIQGQSVFLVFLTLCVAGILKKKTTQSYLCLFSFSTHMEWKTSISKFGSFLSFFALIQVKSGKVIQAALQFCYEDSIQRVSKILRSSSTMSVSDMIPLLKRKFNIKLRPGQDIIVYHVIGECKFNSF